MYWQRYMDMTVAVAAVQSPHARGSIAGQRLYYIVAASYVAAAAAQRQYFLFFSCSPTADGSLGKRQPTSWLALLARQAGGTYH